MKFTSHYIQEKDWTYYISYRKLVGVGYEIKKRTKKEKVT